MSNKHTSARWAQGLALGAAVLAVALLAISCGTDNRAAVLLPEVPGAKYIGSKECETCHDTICRDFVTSDHARLIAEGKNGLEAGCESCHGPCSLHSDSGGETKPPYAFTTGRPVSSSYGAHQAAQPPRTRDTVCFNCHMNVRGEFTLPNHHPVPEGKMACIDCHPPHKGSAFRAGGTALTAENEACVKCHPAQRGPYAFEHDALREGCLACHKAHGSINAKLLSARDANLCLKCHFQQYSGGRLLIGGSDHTTRARQGACWMAGCHEAVHGSRVSSSLRF